MQFSQAQYQAVIDKLTSALDDLANKLNQLRNAAQSAIARATGNTTVQNAIAWVTNQIVQVGTSIINKIKDLLKGAAAPIFMYVRGYDWEDIRGLASTVAGELKPEVIDSGGQWVGAGHDAYARNIRPQGDAATRIATIADRTAGSLTTVAGFGLAFYVALGVVVAKFIAATVTAIAAFGTAALSWAGALIIVEEAAVTPAMLIALCSALAAALGAQAAQLATLHGEASDNSAFPGGSWPRAATAQIAP
jgi:hypothetical protein